MSNDDNLRNASLDALALIGATVKNDSQGVNAMLSTYGDSSDEAERGMLLGGMLAHAVALLTALADARGCKPEDIVKNVHDSIVSAAVK